MGKYACGNKVDRLSLLKGVCEFLEVPCSSTILNMWESVAKCHISSSSKARKRWKGENRRKEKRRTRNKRRKEKKSSHKQESKLPPRFMLTSRIALATIIIPVCIFGSLYKSRFKFTGNCLKIFNIV